ncbi:hypothetical protein K2173_015150 [Erythroxylum novogranatense]|uniref:Uncharacterized protein n=1 Tax=Erythroxylum novogranatense TaxID=1862640 RepID=A0AAV8T1P6_9ROSI|nr:hypothetical protein K2173_015150 [Erythroxylum novogranatense]
MDSCAELKRCDRATTFPASKNASSRRTPSFSFSSSSTISSSSSSFYVSNDLPPSPATPLRFSGGVPFSWEHLPGIPKNPNHKKRDSTLKVLPLPPSSTIPTSKRFTFEEVGHRKKIFNEGLRRDPFFTALVQCSRDNNCDKQSFSNIWDRPKVSRSVGDRFGFTNLYTSCKNTCAISESIVYIPRSKRSSYDLINRRSP